MLKTKENGITLVALVITIIVILILAGISISMIAGDNGILTQASNASDEMDLANVKSDLELALANCQASYYAEKYSGGDKDVTNYFTANLINEGMGENYIVTGSITADANSTLKITIDETTYKATVHVTSTGKVENIDVEESDGSVETLADVVTSANYGDYVNYSVDLNDNGDYCDDWRIFYNDGENIFIIAADCISSDLVPSEVGTTYYSNGGIFWRFDDDEKLSIWQSATLSNARSEFLISGFCSMSESNNNYKAACSLLDPDRWTSFLDGYGYGSYAIGGATLEMFISSFKQTMSQEINIKVSSEGYAIDEEDWSTTGVLSLDFSSSSDLESLYNLGEGSCYWLASPMSGLDDLGSLLVGCESLLIFMITNDTSGSDYSWSSDDPEAQLFLSAYAFLIQYCVDNSINFSDVNLGVRPVVMLKSTVLGDAGDNVWYLSD